MVVFNNTLRGDGLARTLRVLEGLEEDPQRLDRARRRFSDSPPPYTLHPSVPTTRSESPVAPAEGQRRREEQEWQLIAERQASLPYNQYEVQIAEELDWLRESNPQNQRPRLMGGCVGSIGGSLEEEAKETIKKRWIEQGIWNHKWNSVASGIWKHEEPLEVESESETDTEAESATRLSFFGSRPSGPKLKRAKCNEERKRIAERRAISEREREASRPFHQFVFQLSIERERIQAQSGNESASAANINSRAYAKVKETWTKRGIWNNKWIILPGMSWKHENPLEELVVDDPLPATANMHTDTQAPTSHVVVEAPFGHGFGSAPHVEPPISQESSAVLASQQGPPGNLRSESDDAVNPMLASTVFGHNLGSAPSAEPDHPQDSSVMVAAEQEQSVSIGSVDGENSNADNDSSASDLPRTEMEEQYLDRIWGHTSRRRNRKSSQTARPLMHESLGPIHPSKISKAVAKTRNGPQRYLSKKLSNSSQTLPQDANPEELQASPAKVTPFGSKRVQPPARNVRIDQTGTAAKHSSKPTTSIKRVRNVAKVTNTRASARLQGISKRGDAKMTQRRAMKE